MIMRFRYLMVAMFFGISSLPLICGVMGLTLVEPIQENRRLAPTPTWAGMSNLSVTTTEAMKWFDDHFGLRSLLIRVKNQLDFSVFHTSARVYIGRSGWIFRRSIIDSEEPAVEAMSTQAMDDLLNKIAALRDLLARRNVRLVIIIPQMGYKFYPEGLPSSLTFAAKWRRIDDFQQRLGGLENITYIDTWKLLMPYRNKYQLYQKTDFHWAEPA